MQMREALAVASTKSRLAAVSSGALFQLEIHADRDLCFDRLATERGGTITPLTDRRERRRNQPLVALDNLEICGNSICADRGVDEHFALKVRLPRAAGIDRCYTLHQDRGLQSRWANRRWDFRRNNSGRFKTACRQPVVHRTVRRSDAVEIRRS